MTNSSDSEDSWSNVSFQTTKASNTKANVYDLEQMSETEIENELIKRKLLTTGSRNEKSDRLEQHLLLAEDGKCYEIPNSFSKISLDTNNNDIKASVRSEFMNNPLNF